MATHRHGEESDEEMLDPTEQLETPLPQLQEETKLHSGVARQPTIVHRQQHMRSREACSTISNPKARALRLSRNPKILQRRKSRQKGSPIFSEPRASISSIMFETSVQAARSY